MSDITRRDVTATTVASAGAPEGAPVLRHRISWGAILAGALVAVAVGAMLNILGVAIGATAVDAVQRDTPNASTFGITGAIWLLVANLLGLAVGGYVAARLSGTSDKRDATLHGLAVWATAYLVSAVLLGNLATGVASTAGRAVSSVAGGVTQAASSVAGGAAGAAGQAAQGVDADDLLNRARLALSGPTDVARMTTEQRAAEITSLLGKRVANGNLSNDDRTRLNRLVAAEAGIPEQEAAQRIQSYEAEAQRTAQEAEQRAREAANAAATGAAAASFWIFAALLLGAIATILGSRAGTRDMILMTERRTLA
ncbi:hypothetical protein ACE7GA_24700 [Roseomonas sp. CCTCC AB2023176]|uniref:hypothetical protein n=1 Tax=Roseomonas sp. CCTCC AB2023176 TaxID=3342640 RepID=UPI0035DB47D1